MKANCTKRLLICKKANIYRQKSPRKLRVGFLSKNYCSNQVRTVKYIWWNFIPKNLLIQFMVFSNIYYLVLSILYVLPQFSDTDGSDPTLAIAFAVLVIFSMIKDLIEDLRRRRFDNQENERPVRALVNGQYRNIPSRQLMVGQIIEIEEKQIVPADILLLESSASNNVCYIETSNLDGETTIKMRVCERRPFQATELTQIRDVPEIELKYDAPNTFINKFQGLLSWKNNSNELVEISVDEKNIINRGCSLKNTAWARGVVVYTGNETKIMLNLRRSHAKVSSVGATLNRRVLELVVMQLILTLIGALYDAFWLKNRLSQLPYLIPNGNQYNFSAEFGINFPVWNLGTEQVPLSAYIHLEIIRLIQCGKIVFDNDMKTADGIKPTVQESKLIEELGKVNVIFSDKTGTLTKNIMSFKYLSTGSRIYELHETSKKNPSDSLIEAPSVSATPLVTKLKLEPSDLLENSLEHQKLHEMINSIALCHEVILDKKGEYHAASSDELALVNFAKTIGVEFLGFYQGELNKYLLVDRNNKDKELVFDILQTFEFTSDRRRMSIVISDSSLKSQDLVRIITKGADSTMFQMAKVSEGPQTMREHADDFSSKGLRTLVYGIKDIPLKDYNQWREKYREAETAAQERKEKMRVLQAELETGLKIIGVTAVEDGLQDNLVPTLQFIRDAQIKVWMITGDKAETAKNIARTCGLASQSSEFFVLDDSSEDAALKHLNDFVLENSPSEKYSKTCAMVSGMFLEFIHSQFQNHSLINKLLKKLHRFETVVVYRVFPKQKADIVSYYKKSFPNKITLAIGDGANDTAMLVAADIGIGIKGVESQAARVSDYAIGEFQHLKKLMFYHGREGYRRNTNLIRFLCFRNTLSAVPPFYYGFMGGMSSQKLYDTNLDTFYQLLFGGTLGITVYAVFDEEHPVKELMSRSKFYDIGRKNMIFKWWNFWGWILKAAVDCILLTMIPIWVLGGRAIDFNGLMSTFWLDVTTIFLCAVLICAFKVVVMSSKISFLLILGLLIGPGAFLILYMVLSSIHSYQLYYTFQESWQIANFYWVIFVILVAFAIPELAFKKWNILILNIDNRVKTTNP